MRKLLNLSLALIVSLFLAACDTVEERAEEHFQNAKTLLDEGDADRALVELRNVLALIPNDLEARHLLASTLLTEKGLIQNAYSQYLRIIEQYPDDLESRIQLSELAFFANNWEEMDRHGSKARELAPDNPEVQVIAAAMDYRTAVTDDDASARSEVARVASGLIDPADPNRILRELILDNHLRNQEFSDSLASLDSLLADFPEEQRYWRQRLQVLIATDDQPAIEAQLIDLVERFPEDEEQKQLLVRYFLSRGELDKTETFLRKQVELAPEDDATPRIDLIRFLLELRTPDAARAEIDAAIATAQDRAPFIMLSAAIDFAQGNVEKAISDVEAEIETAEPSDLTNEMKISLARMLTLTGNAVGARSLVETVLIEDATNVPALKMNASWLIEADDTDAAIAGLRTVLDQDPDDAEALSLMAAAYTRTGSNTLARDFLALAAEASGNAPAETVRYARLLISEERFLPAEDVLLPALRIEPNNLELLQTAALLYLGMEDDGRTRQVIDTLRQIETPEATSLAVQLEAERLNRSSGVDEAMDYLESLAGRADTDTASRILLLRARLSTGDLTGAIEQAESLLSDDPDNPAGLLVLAKTLAAAGELDRSISVYEELIEDFPEDPSLRTEIASVYSRRGDPDLARGVIADALDVTPNDARLLWASASYLESDGDIDGAIAIYEQMYAQNSGDIIIANNLASLLGAYKDDEQSLDRAWTIARRFRETEIPAVQDTYGWIAHRRGDSQEALPFLTAAAAGLPDDPIVQFHLAEVLYALGRNDEALAQFRKTLTSEAVGDTRPQFETTRTRINELETVQQEGE